MKEFGDGEDGMRDENCTAHQLESEDDKVVEDISNLQVSYLYF